SPSPAATLSSPLSLHDALPISSVANWWTCALHQQVEFLASEKGKQQSFPGQVSSDSDMNTDYFLEIWETNVKKLYWKSSARVETDRKSTRLNSSHVSISYAVFC